MVHWKLKAHCGWIIGGKELAWRKQKNNDLLKVNVLERLLDYILVSEWKIVRSGSISIKPKEICSMRTAEEVEPMWERRELKHGVLFSGLVCWLMAVFSAEKAMAPHSNTLAWKIPWTEEPGRLQSMGSLRVGHDWATSLSLFTFVHWRRKWQPTPVCLPGVSQVSCRLWGHTESDTTERLHFHFSLSCIGEGDGNPF